MANQLAETRTSAAALLTRTRPSNGSRPMSRAALQDGPTPEDGTSLTDLVETIRNGDLEVWPELVARLSVRVATVLRKFSVDSHLRNDAAAETWRTLFEKLDQIENPESLPAWAAVVARNNMLDLIKRRGRFGPPADLDAVLEHVGSIDTDAIVEAEIGQALRKAVSRLSPKERAIVEGRVFTDSPESLKAMGERLDMPTGSIGPTLGRSLIKLRRDPELRRFLADPGAVCRSKRQLVTP